MDKMTVETKEKFNQLENENLQTFCGSCDCSLDNGEHEYNKHHDVWICNSLD